MCLVLSVWWIHLHESEHAAILLTSVSSLERVTTRDQCLLNYYPYHYYYYYSWDIHNGFSIMGSIFLHMLLPHNFAGRLQVSFAVTVRQLIALMAESGKHKGSAGLKNCCHWALKGSGWLFLILARSPSRE